MKYEVKFLSVAYLNFPGNWLAYTTYKISAKNEKEAKKKGINKFKKRFQMKRFLSTM